MTSRTPSGMRTLQLLLGSQPLGREGALLDEQPHDLGHEERVALGLAVDRRDQAAGGVIPAVTAMKRPTSSRVEAAQQ